MLESQASDELVNQLQLHIAKSVENVVAPEDSAEDLDDVDDNASFVTCEVSFS